MSSHDYALSQRNEPIIEFDFELNNEHDICLPRPNWLTQWRFKSPRNVWWSLLEDFLRWGLFVAIILINGNNWWTIPFFIIYVPIPFIVLGIRFNQIQNEGCYGKCVLTYIGLVITSVLFTGFVSIVLPFTMWNFFNAHGLKKRDIRPYRKVSDLGDFIPIGSANYSNCCGGNPPYAYPSSDSNEESYTSLAYDTQNYIFDANTNNENWYGIKLKIATINYYLSSMINSKIDSDKTSDYYNKEPIADIAHSYNRLQHPKELSLKQMSTDWDDIKFGQFDKGNRISSKLKLAKFIFACSMLYRLLDLASLVIGCVMPLDSINYILIGALCVYFVFKIVYVTRLCMDFHSHYILLHIVSYKQMLETYSSTKRATISENAEILMDIVANTFDLRDIFVENAGIPSEIVQIIMQYSNDMVLLPEDGDIDKIKEICSNYRQVYYDSAA